MEFQKERVFTALNADELKPGSKVIAANSIGNLKELVEQNMAELSDLTRIDNAYSDRRFIVNEDTDRVNSFAFVYLVSEPEETWIAYLCRGKDVVPYLTACRSYLWKSVQEDYGAKTKLFEGTEEEVEEWYTARKHLAYVMAAWEDGKTIQFFDVSIDGWRDVEKPKWSIHSQYRIKPEGLKWTDLKIGDIVRRINLTNSYEAMVIAIDKDPATGFHVMIGDDWVTDKDLANDWEKVE